MKKFSLLTVAFLGLLSCQDDDTAPNTQPVTIAFETEKTGMFGNGTPGVSQAQNFVINSQADWDSFANVYVDPVGAIDVDYAQKTVISAVCDFRTGMGDLDAFGITSVIQQNDTVKVTIHSFTGSTTGAEAAMSYEPYHVISIPKTTLPFQFIYTE